jgi:hypothetical protein
LEPWVTTGQDEIEGRSRKIPAIALGSDGNPVIAYTDSAGKVKVDACTTAACSSFVTTTIYSENSTSWSFVSIAVGNDGNPVIAFNDNVNEVLKVAACSNTTCTSSTVTTVDSTAGGAKHISITIGNDGNPVISHWKGILDSFASHEANGLPRVVACSNPTCSSASSTYVGSGSGFGTFSSIVIGSDGSPQVAFSEDSQILSLANCANSTCSSVDSWRSLDQEQDLSHRGLGMLITMVIGNDGLPILVSDYLELGVRVTKCADATCSTASTTTYDSETPTQHRSRYPAIAVGSTGYPIITFSNDSGLNLIRCSNEACSEATTIMLGGSSVNPVTSSLAVDSSGNPVIAYAGGGASAVGVATL